MQKFYWLYEKYFFYLVVGLLIFIPLYPKFPLISVNGTFVSIRLEDIIIASVLLLWFIVNLKKLPVLFSRTITKLFLLFWFVGILSFISGYFITQSVQFNLGLLHLARRIEYMSLFFVAATSVSYVAQVRTVIKSILLTVLIVVIYGYGQIYLGFPVISTNNSEFSKGLVLYLTNGARVNSTFAGHYDLAMYLSMTLVLTIAFFFYKKSKKYKFILATLGILEFILLGLTAARVSFAAAIAALCLVCWMSKQRFLLVLIILASVGLVLGVPELRHRLVATLTVNILGGGGAKYSPPSGTVTIFTPEKNIPEASRATLMEQARKDATDPAKANIQIPRDVVPGEPVNTTELGVYRSFGIRFDVEWPRALNAFYKNPLLGTGYSSITLATDNDYLRSLGETGVLGTLSLVLIFGLLFKKILNFLKNNSMSLEKYFVIGMFGGSFALLSTGLFIDVLEASKIAEIYWILMGTTWAVVTRYEN